MRIRMHGMGDYVTRAAGLDNAAGVHHRHAVRQARHDRQVVRDPDQARARLAAQLLHFKKDLPLDRHVQRRRGLIRNDQAGRIQQRDGARYALPHAARQLVRIGAQAFLRRRDAHHRQRLQGALARLFARPANVLVLDGPTHGLDIETLELLEELLQEYAGTVLLVSHDRAFLNNVVTQTIAYEGDGRWRDYVGGYDEWVAQRPAPSAPAADVDSAAKPVDESAARAKAAKPKPAKATKMNAWDLRELEGLPDAIAALEAQQAELAGKLADGSLYRDAPAEVDRINGELAKLESELEERFARWELLEARRDGTL
ncbi:hypothetical protein G6F65_014415 [Rhizopus arrhizus]|nr:hypothetical protein G6F65_014415 [Rhizopus arrhizus]